MTKIEQIQNLLILVGDFSEVGDQCRAYTYKIETLYPSDVDSILEDLQSEYRELKELPLKYYFSLNQHEKEII